MKDLEQISSKIYEIRNQKVMLDYELASMYGVETAQLKRAVRRNMERFEGEDFMFELTKDELLRCQIGTLKKGQGQHFKYMPFAFTDLGVAMLSSVLRSKTAIEINRGIMRAFVTVRQMLSQPKPDKISILEKRVEKLENYIEEVLTDVNDANEDTQIQLELINASLAELQVKVKAKASPNRNKIGFKPSN